MAFDIDIGFASQAGRKPLNEDFCAAMLPTPGQEGMGSVVAIADGVSAGGGPSPTSHDKDDHNCTMSYNFAAERKWCGFCILRLAGWNKSKLKNDATKNTK